MAILEADEHAESDDDEEAPRRPGAVEVDEDTIEALTALLSYLSNECGPHPSELFWQHSALQPRHMSTLPTRRALHSCFFPRRGEASSALHLFVLNSGVSRKTMPVILPTKGCPLQRHLHVPSPNLTRSSTGKMRYERLLPKLPGDCRVL